MSYEYIYVNQRGMSLNEFMEKLNEYGDEGYHLVHQDTFGIFLLERQVYPEMTAIGSSTSLSRSGVFVSDATLLLICAFILVMVFAIAARDFHWV